MTPNEQAWGSRESGVGSRVPGTGNPRNGVSGVRGQVSGQRSRTAASVSPLPLPHSRLPTPISRLLSLRHARRAFTLIELLVVIGIMGLLLGITVTAFDGMGKGAKMRAAVTELKGALSLARQTAITQRRVAYLIFTDTQTDLSIAPHLYSTRYQSYLITTRWHTNIADSAGNNQWIPRPGDFGQWRHLPKGIIFDRDRVPDSRVVINPADYANVYNRATRDNVHNIAFPFDFYEDSYITQACVAIAFHPNRRLVDADPNDGAFLTPVVFITEGFVDYNLTTGGVNEYFKYENATAYSLAIRPLTGRIKVVELTE